MSQPAFSDEFRRQLANGKYTYWAEDLSEEHLRAVLWMVGEFAGRSLSIVELLDQHRAELSGAMRGVLALQALSQVINYRERFDVNGWVQRMMRGRAWLEPGDLPEGLRAELGRAATGIEWKGVIAKDGYELWGGDASGKSVGARIDPAGHVTITRLVEAATVPQAVRDAFSRQMPGAELHSVHTLGPNLQVVQAYEFTATDAQHRTRKVVIPRLNEARSGAP